MNRRCVPNLEQDIRDNVVDLADKLEERVFREMLERKLALGGIPGVGLAQHGVAVARNHLAALEGRPDVLLDSLIRRIFANLGLHLAQPDQDFLVRQTMERARETVERGGERKEGVGESRANEFSGVGRDITTFVVAVNGDVETHQFHERLVVAESEQGGQVVGIVLGGVNRWEFSLAVNVPVDTSSDVGKLGDTRRKTVRNMEKINQSDGLQVHGIFESRTPVLLLGHAILVGFGKGGVVI
jgi:hypothetical protein